jgi:hypothetical protein
MVWPQSVAETGRFVGAERARLPTDSLGEYQAFEHVRVRGSAGIGRECDLADRPSRHRWRRLDRRRT